MFEKVKDGITDDKPDFEKMKELSGSFPNINMFYVKREWNIEADRLAKLGVKRSNIIKGWF